MNLQIWSTNQLTIKGDLGRLKSFIRNNAGYPLLYKDKRKLYFPDNELT